MLLIAKSALLACFRGILCKPLELNGKLLGFKKLISRNFQVKYLENRNNPSKHFALFRNHLDQHFAGLGWYVCERLTLSKYHKRLGFDPFHNHSDPPKMAAL